jgi:hypothetical protein
MPEYIKIPRPEESPSKIVQLYIGDKPTYVCDIPVLGSGGIFLNHGDILGQTLKELGIAYEEITLSKGSAISMPRQGPEKNGERYKLVGAGICARKGEILYLGSNSSDYDDIGINPEHLERCRPFFEKEGFSFQLMNF